MNYKYKFLQIDSPELVEDMLNEWGASGYKAFHIQFFQKVIGQKLNGTPEFKSWYEVILIKPIDNGKSN